jgi:uncharacterized protein
LMAGGLFLCFEGFEKVAHKLLHSPSEDEAGHAQLLQALSDESVDVLALEKEKIKGAVRTDFILSTEIIVITLGTVAGAGFVTQFSVLAGVAALMTAGVYGLVAGIVKIDDLGLYLTQRPSGAALEVRHALGRGLLRAAPLLMKSLTVLGTLAMFLVGGGILAHGWHSVGAWLEGLSQLSGSLAPVASVVLGTVFGVLAGGAVFVVVTAVGWVRSGLHKK